MKAEIKNGKLVLTLDIEPYKSPSGLSNVIASSHGNQTLACLYEDKPITVGVNAFQRIPGAVKKEKATG